MKKQRGEALILAIVMALAFFGIVFVVVRLVQYSLVTTSRTTNANALKTVTASLQYYAAKNKVSLQKGYRIDGIAVPTAPTLTELQSQQYLTLGVSSTTPFGSQFKTILTVAPTGAISGFVYTQSGVINNGSVDSRFACEVASNLGEIGFCSTENSPSVIGNSSNQVANPAGNFPAIVAGSIFVSA
ncbi:MAG: hypothetical protein Q7T74_06965 [Candidatus Saccharibacteria bacterium]|nr:hypothetical protein [Candidatus Saccharibacteria bacterium]